MNPYLFLVLFALSWLAVVCLALGPVIQRIERERRQRETP